jgi:hypothetical protein
VLSLGSLRQEAINKALDFLSSQELEHEWRTPPPQIFQELWHLLVDEAFIPMLPLMPLEVLEGAA